MKIFISYSREDARDVAEHIRRVYTKVGHEVFVDDSTIQAGEQWASKIRENISNCDIFLTLITNGSLNSDYVEKEVQEAKRQRKIIIPCKYQEIRWEDTKWGLSELQGLEFEDKYSLLRKLPAKISGILSTQIPEYREDPGSRRKLEDSLPTDDSTDKDVSKSGSTPPNHPYTPKYKERYPTTESKKALGINLKILIPILVVGVVGSIVTFVIFGSLSPGNPPQYSFVRAWGSPGTADGQFSQPTGVAADFDNVYVADTGNDRIQMFDINGNFITKWGSIGSGNGQFSQPTGVAADFDNVYVADTLNHRIQKFDSNGKFITQWGSFGSAEGQFRYPTDLTVDSGGNLYVADRNNYRIQKFDSNGKFITQWGSKGAGNGQFHYPAGVSVDFKDNVYIADNSNSRIQKFDSDVHLLQRGVLRVQETDNSMAYMVLLFMTVYMLLIPGMIVSKCLLLVYNHSYNLLQINIQNS